MIILGVYIIYKNTLLIEIGGELMLDSKQNSLPFHFKLTSGNSGSLSDRLSSTTEDLILHRPDCNDHHRSRNGVSENLWSFGSDHHSLLSWLDNGLCKKIRL
jgi:hypothetical protein